MTKLRGRAARKAIAVLFTMSMVGLFGTGTASATHTHSVKTGNGSCVLLAQNGGEKDVVLPFEPEGERSHPIHALVHKGEPGKHINIGVYGSYGTDGSDPCKAGRSYLND
jgi:hypothetical protein